MQGCDHVDLVRVCGLLFPSSMKIVKTNIFSTVKLLRNWHNLIRLSCFRIGNPSTSALPCLQLPLAACVQMALINCNLLI